ncbi:MAG: 3-dehydroquinate synthase [Candidatus Omnitrophica bacterium]|jgi:3-dehydroquinate synthase|nr:3-dehydroquinate synthase [Candidatus Omnitrophota bacterium]
MKTINVNLKRHPYKIIVGRDILKLLPGYIRSCGLGPDAYIITNNFIKKAYGKELEKTLIRAGMTVRFKSVADSEKSKSLKTAGIVLNDLVGYDKNKKIFIIGFGGGVIGDLAGFVASIYRRGIPLVQIPTTLLAQVDSSIGGKTAVDLEAGKNLAGSFYQPAFVLADIKFLKTLDRRQLKAGLAEVIKYALIKDKKLLGYLEGNRARIIDAAAPCLESIVGVCVRIKAKIVAADEKEEKGLRTVLNFGHTVGHAIEAAGGFRRYNHGEAVSLGMLVANDISVRLKMLAPEVKMRLERLIRSFGLPYKIKGLVLDRIIRAYYHDKKFKGSVSRLVLLGGIAKTMIVENIALSAVKGSIKDRF